MKERDYALVIQGLYPSMRDADKRIADFVLAKPELVISMNVTALAKELSLAPSTIVGFCKLIHYKGFPDMKLGIARNLKLGLKRIMDDIQREDDVTAVVEKVFRNSTQALMDTHKQLDMEMIEQAVHLLKGAKRILFFGLGTSSTIAMDAYYRFMRIGLPAAISTDPLIMRSEALMMDKDCVAFAISHFGRTRDVVRTAEIAREAGAKVIGLSSFQNTPLQQVCDIVFITNTHETKIMQEAMNARLAQIALLDSLLICLALEQYDTASEKLSATIAAIEEIRL